MSKTTALLLEILKNGRNTTGKEWKDLIAAIKAKPDESKIFATNIKNKIKSLNLETQVVCLDLLDYAMVECKMPLHTAISSKDFITSLINLLKTRDSPEVSQKILFLIKKWGLRFESQKDIIPNFYETYISLKNSGVVFPDNMESTYQIYVGASNEKQENYFEDKTNIPECKEVNPNSIKTKFDLSPSNYPEKYKKFVKELSVILENISLGNEMITGSDPSRPIDDGLSCILNNLKDLGRNLMLAIENQIKDDKLMNLCLAINDDISLTITRYEELKKKKKPRPFRSALKDEEDFQVSDLNEMNKKTNDNQTKKQNNLIDIFDDLNACSNVNKNTNNITNTNVNNNNIFGGNNNDFFDMIGGGSSQNTNLNTNNQMNTNPFQNNVNNNTTSNKGNVDLFSFDTNPVTDNNTMNTNNNLINNSNPKPIDKKANLTDLISSLYENNYSGNTNNKDPFNNNNMLNMGPSNMQQNAMLLPNNNMYPMNNMNMGINMNPNPMNNMNMYPMNNPNMYTMNNMNMNNNMFNNPYGGGFPGNANNNIQYPNLNTNMANNNNNKNPNNNNNNIYPDFF